MSARVDLFALYVPGNDPHGLMSAWLSPVRPAPVFSFPLVANPPPDTLFMRVNEIDLAVFGEDDLSAWHPGASEGALQMIDYESLQQNYDSGRIEDSLASLVERDAVRTAKVMSRYAANHAVRCDEEALVWALRTGEWPTKPDAMLQAAAFARQLLDLIRIVIPIQHSAVWAYVGRLLSYDYP